MRAELHALPAKGRYLKFLPQGPEKR